MYRDIRFDFLKDNPFPADNSRALCRKLIQYMDSRVSEFSEKTDKDISILYTDPSITELFGVPVSKDKYSNPLINKLKSFIMNSKSLPGSLKEKYAKILNFSEPVPAEVEDEGEEYSSEDEPVEKEVPKNVIESDDEEDFGPVPAIMPEKFNYSRTSGLTNYDISSTKPLSYDDLRQLTINIARSELVPIVHKEEYKLKLEEQKRLELQEEINKYRKIREIGALTQDDLTTMNLTQLTELAKSYQKAYEEKKLYTVFKKGGNILTTITSTVLPNGIRIGKDPKTGNERYIQMKGALKEITNQIFDSSSVQGHAFGNLLKKSNIAISDSVLAIISIAETMISNIQVVEVPTAQPIESSPELQAIESKPDDDKDVESIYDEDDDYEDSAYSNDD